MFDEPWDDHELARREAELATAGDWTEFELGFEPDWFRDESADDQLGSRTAA